MITIDTHLHWHDGAAENVHRQVGERGRQAHKAAGGRCVDRSVVGNVVPHPLGEIALHAFRPLRARKGEGD